MMAAITTPEVDERTDLDGRADPERPWQTVVWDDPVIDGARLEGEELTAHEAAEWAVGEVLGAGDSLLVLRQATDAHATVDASGYFTNGYDLGMRDGDLAFVYDTGNKIWSAHTVLNASGTTIDLANGTNVGVATNSD